MSTVRSTVERRFRPMVSTPLFIVFLLLTSRGLRDATTRGTLPVGLDGADELLEPPAI